jgi:uncharacterized Zn finger protein (UPF0148 family)
MNYKNIARNNIISRNVECNKRSIIGGDNVDKEKCPECGAELIDYGHEVCCPECGYFYYEIEKEDTDNTD